MTNQPFRGRTPYSQKDIHTGQRKKAACRGGHRKICDALSRLVCVRVRVCVRAKEREIRQNLAPARERERRPNRICLSVFACLLFSALFAHGLNEKTAPPRIWPSFLPARTNCSRSSLDKEGSATFSTSETSFHSSFENTVVFGRRRREAAFFRQFSEEPPRRHSIHQ